MTEPYQCPKCGETLIKLETNVSKDGYMIPTNFYDGIVSKRGENHLCPKNVRMPKPKSEKPYVNERAQDLANYMRNMARLGNDGHWHLWLDGKYRGPVEKARKEDYESWNGEVIIKQ